MNCVTAIILAAGVGSRMNLRYNKVLHVITKPLLWYTIEAFEKNDTVDEIVVVASHADRGAIEEIVREAGFSKVQGVILGGQTRQASSYEGVQWAEKSSIVLVHDGARPFVTDDVITQCVRTTEKLGGCVVAVPAKDTMKLVTQDNFVKETLDRSQLWSAQTPQTFRRDILWEAHKSALDEGFQGTDEASLVERIGKKVKIVEGRYTNIKVTTPEDLVLAEKIIHEGL